MIRRVFLVSAFVASLFVAGPSSAATCADGSLPTLARFVQPQDGMIQAQTGPTGTLTVQTGGVIPAIFISTTGSIQVEIEQSCLLTLDLVVYKNGNPNPIHTNSWTLSCNQSRVFDTVNIGLDGGNYTFQLSGTACNGKPTRGDGKGGFVGDPPIL